jgi:hypothetical protein
MGTLITLLLDIDFRLTALELHEAASGPPHR